MNLWDILILAAVACAVFFAARRMRKKKKSGCGCGCEGCTGCPAGRKSGT
jgi:hypothetical protein